MKNYFLLVFYSFLFLYILPSCEYKKTSFELDALFEPTLDFSKTSQFTFDENFVEVKNGKAQLKPLDLKQTENDFNRGNYVGTFYDSQSKVIRPLEIDQVNVNSILPNRLLNLQGYWKFDGDYHDQSMNNDSGVTSGGVVFEPGLVRQGVSLDGIDGFVDLGSSVVDTGSGQTFSISFWTEVDSYTANYLATIGHRFIHTDSHQYGLMCFSHDYSGSLEFRCGYRYYDSGISYSERKIFGNLTGWQHVAITSDGTNVFYYHNGSLVDTGVTGTTPSNIGQSLFLGKNLPISSHFSDSKIDELAIYNTQLTSVEINKLYSNSVLSTELSSSWAPKWDNLVGYWKMDGNWRDSSGNNYHMTAQNGSAFISDSKVGIHSGVFDGSDDLSTSSANIPSLTSSSTFSTWIHRSVSSGTDRESIISKAGGSDDVTGSRQPRMDIYNNKARLIMRLAGVNYIISSVSNIEKENWYHLVGTYDHVSGAASVYVNGSLEATSIIPAMSIVGQTGGIALSSSYGYEASETYRWNGSIDDAAVWSVSLSPEEVFLIYNRQKQKYAGHFDSEVIDLGSTTSNWPDLSWSTSLPFGKELVGDYNNDGNTESESSLSYSSIYQQLNHGLISYWSFNEEVTGTAPSGLDLKDLVGSNHVSIHSNFNLGKTGLLSKAIELPGTPNTIGIADSNALKPTDELTYVIWYKRYPNNPQEYSGFVINESFGDGQGTYFGDYSGGGDDVICFRVNADNTNGVCEPNVVFYRWVHYSVTFSNGSLKFYRDGILVDSSTTSNATITPRVTTSLILHYLNGLADELAIWERALSADEVQQIYRRGANRIKLQVKSCVDSNCECKSFSSSPQGSAADCDGDTIVNALDFDDPHKADFIGPGGDGATYYSEAFNRKGTDTLFNCGNNTSDSDGNICVNDEISLIGSPKPEGPSIDFTDFPLSAKPLDNQYIQYRVYMEADDNTACQGSPCLPELSSVNLNPSGATKYYGSVQEIKSIQPIIYKDIQSVKVIADDCVTYQLSPDGTNYYHWISNAWAPVTSHIDSSNQSDFANYISNYSSQFGSGQLFIKALLQTNSQQSSNCSIKSIDFNYSK